MCEYEPDDVLHYRATRSDNPRVDTWVLVERETRAILIEGGFYKGTTILGRPVSIGDSTATMVQRRVVPPEEWPDIIAARVAQFKLTGEIDD